MQNDSNKGSMNIKSENIGESPFDGISTFKYKMHWWVWLLLVDAKAGYPSVNGLKSISNATVKEVIYEAIAFQISYVHTVKYRLVKCLVFDQDHSFVALEHSFPGVKLFFIIQLI